MLLSLLESPNPCYFPIFGSCCVNCPFAFLFMADLSNVVTCFQRGLKLLDSILNLPTLRSRLNIELLMLLNQKDFTKTNLFIFCLLFSAHVFLISVQLKVLLVKIGT